MADDDEPHQNISDEPFAELMGPDSDLPSDQSAYDRQLQEYYTRSLDSSVTDYNWINGRRYHAFKEGSYPFPNDEREKDRNDVQHKLFEVAMFGRLHFSPLEDPKLILDIGTGTGIWAMEMAERYPDAEVLGNDLSPIQPTWVPPNLRFEVDDAEADWVYTEQFDLIHCRAMNNAIRDWPRLVRQAYKSCKVGGYVEFIDFDSTWRSPDDTVPANSHVGEVNRLFVQAIRERGLEPNPGLHHERWMREAGFEDVHVTRLPIPLGTWPADEHLKEVGAWHYFTFIDHVEAFLTYLFTSRYGYTQQECLTYAALVRKQVRDPKTHAFFDLYVTYGRKGEFRRPHLPARAG